MIPAASATSSLSPIAPVTDGLASSQDREDSSRQSADRSWVQSSTTPTDSRAANESEANGPAVATTIAETVPSESFKFGASILCAMAILGWTIVVSLGVAVPTKPYIDLIKDSGLGLPFPALLYALVAILTCYTFTNIGALSCLAAIVGAIGRSARIDDSEPAAQVTDLRTVCLSAAVRGFFLFLMIASGTILLSEQKFDAISIEQYLKMAGLVSLLSFAVGYDPHLFGVLFKRVLEMGEKTTSVR
jgi:hypothetical protein